MTDDVQGILLHLSANLRAQRRNGLRREGLVLERSVFALEVTNLCQQTFPVELRHESASSQAVTATGFDPVIGGSNPPPAAKFTAVPCDAGITITLKMVRCQPYPFPRINTERWFQNNGRALPEHGSVRWKNAMM